MTDPKVLPARVGREKSEAASRVKERQAALGDGGALSGLIPAAAVTSGEKFPGGPADDGFRRRVALAVIECQIRAYEDGEGAAAVGLIAEAIERAGCTLDQYLQLLEDPDWLSMKARLERSIVCDSRMTSMLLAASNAAVAGDPSAMRLLLSYEPKEDPAMRALLEELRITGVSGFKQKVADVIERLRKIHEESDVAEPSETLIKEASIVAERREMAGEAVSAIDDAALFPEDEE